MGSFVSKVADQSNPTGKDDLDNASLRQLSYASRTLLKNASTKFSELELYSLRQVLQQIHHERNKGSNTGGGNEGATDKRSPFTINEDAFASLLQIPVEECEASRLFYLSFCNLSVYPDKLDAASPQVSALGFRDLLKPLAFYCHKFPEKSMDIHPARAIFESFAEIPRSLCAIQTPSSANAVDTLAGKATNSDKTDHNIDDKVEGDAVHRSEAIEDSLRNMALEENFEWDPEDDLHTSSGPKIKAEHIVHILAGVLWLIQIATNEATLSSPKKPLAAMAHFMEQARQQVQDMVIYSRTDAFIHDPVDLSAELIDYNQFSKYTTRNMPNIFEILSPYFYNLFLIGDTMNPTSSAPQAIKGQPGGQKKSHLFPESTIEVPVATMGIATSDILTPESLAMLSTFVPLKNLRRSSPMTCLYSGNLHGFSMNQFELHVCKYPAPTLFLIHVKRRLDASAGSTGGNGATTSSFATQARRTSIPFETLSARQRHSISGSTSPSFTKTPWGADTQRTSFDHASTASSSSLRPPLDSSGPTGSPLQAIADEHALTPSPPKEATTLSASPSPRALPASASAQRLSSDNSSPPPPKPLARSKDRMVLGAYVTETWKVSKSGWGNDSFMLFELSPEFEVFPARKLSDATANSHTGRGSSSHSFGGSPPTSGGGRNIHSTLSPTMRSQKNFVHFLKNVGIGFGGHETESCMLFVDDNLQYGTFQQDYASGGNMFMNSAGQRRSGFEVDFEVVKCEVWGLGGPEAKARQQKEWDFEEREANRRASVHIRTKAGEQDIDRDLLEMAGILEPDRGHRYPRRQSIAE